MQIDVPATENHPLEAQIPGKLACQDLKNATARGGDALRHNEMPDLTMRPGMDRMFAPSQPASAGTATTTGLCHYRATPRL